MTCRGTLKTTERIEGISQLKPTKSGLNKARTTQLVGVNVVLSK